MALAQLKDLEGFYEREASQPGPDIRRRRAAAGDVVGILAEIRDFRADLLQKTANLIAFQAALRGAFEWAIASDDLQVLEQVLHLVRQGNAEIKEPRQRGVRTVSSLVATLSEPGPEFFRLPKGQRRALKTATAKLSQVALAWARRLSELDEYEDMMIERLTARALDIREARRRSPPDPWPPE